ncbi:hypothetical protein AB0H43_18440 [Hamadaea sp. NPDC050747]|uniref:hypothetical protein n=1 Tax=Hamadaea sp. NPDC050747 TaxID=3155789 RepID=UPI0033F7A098
MRRVTFSVMAVGAALLLGSPAWAVDPSPSTSAATPAAQGKKVCKLSDLKVGELSGIVATSSGYLAVNTTENVENAVESHQKIWQLTAACKVTGKGISFGGGGSNSPNDIVRAKDGTMWIADTGNAKERQSVALWKLPAALTTPQLFRLTFPEGDKHEVQALLINGDGTPILVTHENDKTAFLYTPVGPLAAGQTTALKQAGKIDILTTVTENILGGAGRKGFTGGAVAPDGTRVALRTQADAYEWDVTGGDVLAALKTEPRVTGLPAPAEQYSGAITYSNDGTQFVTAPRLDKAGDKETAALLAYTPTTKRYVAPPTVKASQGDSAIMKWFKDLTLDQVYMLLAGVGFAGLILVGLGVFGMINGKKKRQKAAAAAKKKAKREREALDEFGDADFPLPTDNAPTTVLAPVPGYDDRRQGGYPDQGGVYGAPPPRPQPGYGQPQPPYGQPQPGPRSSDPWDPNRY